MICVTSVPSVHQQPFREGLTTFTEEFTRNRNDEREAHIAVLSLFQFECQVSERRSLNTFLPPRDFEPIGAGRCRTLICHRLFKAPSLEGSLSHLNLRWIHFQDSTVPVHYTNSKAQICTPFYVNCRQCVTESETSLTPMLSQLSEEWGKGQHGRNRSRPSTQRTYPLAQAMTLSTDAPFSIREDREIGCCRKGEGTEERAPAQHHKFGSPSSHHGGCHSTHDTNFARAA